MGGTRLYVGSLHPDVTENMLRKKFSNIGPISSIEIERDDSTLSMGYAHVTFVQSADAKCALQTLNNTPLKGRPMRIIMDELDTSLRRFENANVYIKNLPTSFGSEDLYDIFSRFGDILSWEVAKDEFGSSRGFGFVQFQTEDASTRAIQQLNGRNLFGKELYVAKHKRHVDRIKEKEENFTNVYVKNFGDGLDDDELEELFEEYGEITSCKVKTDEDGHSKGFGFVNFKHPESARKAVEELNDSQLICSNGSTAKLCVCRHQAKAEREENLRHNAERNKKQGANLYVKNLHETVNDARLKKMFLPFGTITSAKVMVDDEGKSKCFGFVCLSSLEEAAEAIADMHGAIVASKTLHVCFAQSKEDRKAHLNAQRQRRTQSEHRRPPGQYNRPSFSPPYHQPNLISSMNLIRPTPVYPGRSQAATGIDLFANLASQVPPLPTRQKTVTKPRKGKNAQVKDNTAGKHLR